MPSFLSHRVLEKYQLGFAKKLICVSVKQNQGLKFYAWNVPHILSYSNLLCLDYKSKISIFFMSRDV